MGEWDKLECVERDWSGENVRNIVLNDEEDPGNDPSARKVKTIAQS